MNSENNNNELIHIEDRREHYFKISNRIFKQELDIYEIGVYSVLCRFANNNTAMSYPSYQTIADMLKISKRKAMDSVKSLVQKSIIFKKQGNKGFSNKYYLCSLPCISESLVQEMHPPGAPGAMGSAPGAMGVVHQVPPKKTHVKKTHKKDLIKKTGYGEYKNVMLSDDQYNDLIIKYSEPELLKKIEIMSSWLKAKGKSYKDYKAAINNWFKMDTEKQQYQKPKSKWDYEG